MAEHAHPFGEICPGCLNSAAERIRELEAEVARLRRYIRMKAGGS